MVPPDKSPAQIYLIPSVISEGTQNLVITPQIIQAIGQIDYYLAENIRSARRFISSLNIRPVSELHFEQYDKHTDNIHIQELMAPLQSGRPVGVLSEAGCPAIADPGSALVAWAHEHGIPVKPLVGPSSLLLALMASGMNGQHFEFHGYLPIAAGERDRKLVLLENESKKNGKTQIFMETPYRNMTLLNAITQVCHGNTRICIAADLTSPHEFICTRSVNGWKHHLPQIHKMPSLFLMQV